MAGSIVNRMIGAATLSVPTYEEVEHDQEATGQAAIVVVIVAICSAIGSSGRGATGIIGGLIGSLLGWLIWSGVTYIIGDKLLGGTATWGELLRTIGFAQAPGVFNVLGLIPGLGGIIMAIVGLWMLVTGVVAIRQALDFGTGKAIVTAIIGWLAMFIPIALLGGGLAFMGR